MLMHSQIQQASLDVCLHALLQLTISLTLVSAGGTTVDMHCLQLFGFEVRCEKHLKSKEASMIKLKYCRSCSCLLTGI